MLDNLITPKEVDKKIEIIKALGMANTEQGKLVIQRAEKVKYDLEMIEKFISYFSDNAWCVYDRMSSTLIEQANVEYEKNGIDAGERVLLDFYMGEVDKYRFMLKTEPLMNRYTLTQQAFNAHFTGNFFASVPLFLMVIDGAVNEYTKSRGFFAEQTDLSAWDCLVGCNESLAKVKKIISKSRKRTNKEQIRIPYRNGILHGQDLNYANEYVSCKCVALLFAVNDWIYSKESEETRKQQYESSKKPPKLSETLEKIKQVQIDEYEKAKWKKREIIVGDTIAVVPTIEECSDFSYLIPLVKLFNAWERKNYGLLSNVLRKLFHSPSAGIRAGECRELFNDKEFQSFCVKEVEERSCSFVRLLAEATWKRSDVVHTELFEFGCAYMDENSTLSFPWRNDGEWVLIPWNIQGLYKL